MKLLKLLFIFLFIHTAVFAQEEEDKHAEHDYGRHQIGLTFGQTHIPEAIDFGLNAIGIDNSIFVTTIGINYFYSLPKNFGVGVIADIELGKYFLDLGNSDLERDNPLILSAIVSYNIFHTGLVARFGPGIEIEGNKNFGLLKFEVEYEFIKGENWTISPFLALDVKEEYNTWEIGLCISSFFAKKFD